MFHKFMRKIERKPWDHETRLVFADWLEEMGSEVAWGMRRLCHCVPIVDAEGFYLFTIKEKHASVAIWKAAHAAWHNPFRLSAVKPQFSSTRCEDSREYLLEASLWPHTFSAVISDRRILNERGVIDVEKLMMDALVEKNHAEIVDAIITKSWLQSITERLQSARQLTEERRRQWLQGFWERRSFGSARISSLTTARTATVSGRRTAAGAVHAVAQER